MNLRAKWILNPEDQPQFANLLMPQVGIPGMMTGVPETAYLNFGHMNPVIFDLDPGQIPSATQVAEHVAPVMPVARVAMSIDKLREFSFQIQQMLADYDMNVSRGNDGA